jgi:hypothetical protein
MQGILVMLLVLFVGLQPGRAQQLSWEKPLNYATGTNGFGYLQQLAGGDYLVSGIGPLIGGGVPFIYTRVQVNGSLVYQRTGRRLATLEQGVVTLAGRNGSSLLAASIPVWAPGNYLTSRLFFQRIRPNGDTLPGVSYPLSFLEGYPTKAVRESDSVRILTYAVDTQNLGQYALLSTDTLGAVGRVRRYPTPAFGNAYPCDLVRTARGGWLIVGELAAPPYAHPYLVETDVQGRLHRQRELLLFTGSTDERVVRVVNNLVRLKNGSGYVFSGWQRTGGQTWGYLAKLDTALNVVWTYRHPPQATPALRSSHVYELSDGTLIWLAGDGVSNTLGGQPTFYLYIVRLNAGCQLLSQQRVSSADCARLTPYAWQPLAGGGALVVGGASVCASASGTNPAYVARLDNATLLAAAPAPAPASAAGAQVFPNPATDAATWQGAVPVGAGAAELVLLDVLGRVARRVPVAGRGAQVAQALDLSGLAAGTYACRLLVAGQASGGVCRLVVVP